MSEKTDKQVQKTDNKTDKPWLFEKGVSGNPKGRPKKELSMTNALKEIMLEKDPKTKIQRYKKLLNVAMEKAEKGDNDMIKYLVNRIDGLPGGSQGVQIGEVDKLVIVVKDDNTRG